MSKAFTDEEALEPAPIVPERAPLPPGVPNYVTERGLARLLAELAALQAERAKLDADTEGHQHAQALAALARRRAQLEQRIASAELVSRPMQPPDIVRFGATVHVTGEGGVRRYRIVGVDEADAARGDIAFVSPLARALLGRSRGDGVRLRAPGGDQDLEIVSIEYTEEPEGARSVVS